jgi:hypothetical protein
MRTIPRRRVVVNPATMAKRRRNPIEDPALRGEVAGDNEFKQAAAASEEFHGTPAHEVFEVDAGQFFHENTADCGELIALHIISVNGGMVTLKDFGGARLSRSPKGFPPQLFIDGGDQSVDLEAFDIFDEHEMEVLGKLKKVVYFTDKKHLGKKDGGVANYHHTFADRKRMFWEPPQKQRPTVIYDTMTPALSIAGGEYEILPEGIDN